MLSSCLYVTSMKGINARGQFLESHQGEFENWVSLGVLNRVKKSKSRQFAWRPSTVCPQPSGARSIVLTNLLRFALHWFPSVPCLFSYSPKAGFATALKLPYTFMGVSSSMDIEPRNYNFEYQIQTDRSGSSKILSGFLEKWIIEFSRSIN